MKQEENKKMWNERANKFVGHQLSWWDINMKRIEINTISNLLYPNDYVLDVGCSNGVATFELQNKTGAKFLGMDYSEKAIQQAKKFENDNLSFIYKNILEYEETNLFDKVISMRCIINLMDYNDQIMALRKIYLSLKPSGIYIMCEAFSNALNNLNEARKLFGLDPLPMPKYNNYLDENKIIDMTKDMFVIEKVIRHSSMYYIGTRIFQYMCTNDEPKDYDSELHRFFAKYGFETNNSGDFGPNKVYVLKKI